MVRADLVSRALVVVIVVDGADDGALAMSVESQCRRHRILTELELSPPLPWLGQQAMLMSPLRSQR